MIRLYLFAALALILGGCATPYEKTAIKSWDLMADGRASEALSLYEENVKSDKEVLLRLMDEGILLRADARYEESNQKFLQAANIIERAGYVSLSEETISLFVNEKQSTYQGEDFEKVLIHVFLALNFIQLEDWESALVSARKVNEILYIMISEAKRDYELNAFARYLTGLLFEKDADFNSAFISYRQVYEMDKNLALSFIPLQVDLFRMALKMGFEDEVEKFQKIFSNEALELARKSLRQKYASLVLLLESGKSPQKFSSREKHVATGQDGSLVEIALPIPYYKTRASEVVTAELVLGEQKVRASLLNDIESTAIRQLQDRMGRYVAKALAQAALKTGIAVGVGKATNSQELGLLVGLALFMASEADTRSWLLLPAQLQVAKLQIPAGTYSGEIRYLDSQDYSVKTEKLEALSLRPGELKILQRRSF